MTTLVLKSFQINETNRNGFLLLFSVYMAGLSVFLVRSRVVMDITDANSIKIWLLAAVMSGMMALVTFFLKRLLDSIDKTSQEVKAELKEIGVQMKNHDTHIASIMVTLGYHKDKLEWLRNRVVEREHEK